jgi:sodium/potassium-transporting ATPase subunit alpha
MSFADQTSAWANNYSSSMCKVSVINGLSRLANLAMTAENGETPITRELHRFVIIVGSITVLMGAFFFCINFAFGYGIIINTGFMIGIIVANLPEGLMITITVCMSLCC